MTYLARKIRKSRNTPFKQIISYEAQNLPLDPEPTQCSEFNQLRHNFETSDYGVCGYFDPRPGYEQDRSKYEH